MKCKFRKKIWDSEFDKTVVFRCPEQTVKDGFCIFHHPKYWKKNKKQVREAFHEKLENAREDRNKLLCIGYNLPSVKIRGEFRSSLYFSWTKFHGRSNFSHARFFRDVSFAHAEFSKEADFSHTSFSGLADFFRVRFRQKARFEMAKFSGRVFVTRLQGKLRNDPGKPRNVPTLFFLNVEFEKPEMVLFDDFNLARTSFQYTDVSKINFGERLTWGSERRIFDEKLADRGEPFVIYEVVANVYRRLRRNFESRMHYSEAGRFFVGEMECKRKNVQTKNPILRWVRVNILSALAWYKYMSKYGESYSRVIAWMVLTPTLATLLTTLIQMPRLDHFLTVIWQNLQDYVFAVLQLKTDNLQELALRTLSLLLMAQLYISLRRQFERRYKD